jgi:hypothetical protein
MGDWLQLVYSSRLLWLAGMVVGVVAGGVAGWMLSR